VEFAVSQVDDADDGKVQTPCRQHGAGLIGAESIAGKVLREAQSEGAGVAGPSRLLADHATSSRSVQALTGARCSIHHRKGQGRGVGPDSR